ncbi:hypothetical protein [Luteolibacter marinus]|uniref:hypothetical protein n=1 Tax=Luteolibacter marinus TaxID=2776705 RepID=UPI0018673891|nr:hypothetical protein [Luteolibacter marinus]
MRFLLLLCFLLPLAADAQQTGKRTCRVLFLGAGAGDPEKLQLHDGAKCREVDLPRMNLSKVYDLPAGPLTLRLLESAPAEGETVDPKAPEAKVGERIGDFYLLVSPDPQNKVVPVRMQVIDASGDRFRSGQMLWYNLTPNAVGGKVGTQKLAIAARSKLVLDAPASKGGEYPVNLSFRIPGKDQPYPLCETHWSHDPAARTVLFIINEAGSRAPRILGFPDHREDSGKNP